MLDGGELSRVELAERMQELLGRGAAHHELCQGAADVLLLGKTSRSDGSDICG